MSEPIDVIADFFRGQFGHPSPPVEKLIEAFAALAGQPGRAAAPADVSARVADMETVVSALKDAAATFPDLAAKVEAATEAVAALRADLTTFQASAGPAASSDEPTTAQRLDAIDRAMVALQGAVTKLEASPRASAPARATAPAARPTAASA